MSGGTIADLEAVRRAKKAREERMVGASGSGGGDDMERRVAALEKAHEKIDAKLDKLVEAANVSALTMEKRGGAIDTKLATIEGKIDAKAPATDVSEIKGRVAEMPTKYFVGATAIGVFIVAVGAVSSVLIFLDRIRAFLNVH